MTGMMNFHIDPAFVHDLYQKVGLDFAEKVIDPAFNDFVKEVVPMYWGDSAQTGRDPANGDEKAGKNLAKYHIIVDDIYFANIRFSPEYEKAIEAKQVAQQQVETQSRSWPNARLRRNKRWQRRRGEAEPISCRGAGTGQGQ